MLDFVGLSVVGLGVVGAFVGFTVFENVGFKECFTSCVGSLVGTSEVTWMMMSGVGGDDGNDDDDWW